MQVTQRILEILKETAVGSSACGMCKMAILALIEASVGLTQSARLCLKSLDGDPMPPIVADYNSLIDGLNEELIKREIPGRFRWERWRWTWILWYSHDGVNNQNDSDTEVGANLQGEDFTLELTVRTEKEDPSTVQVCMRLSTETDFSRQPVALEPSIAFGVVRELHLLMPVMEIRITEQCGDTERDQISNALTSLLRTSEEHRRLTTESES